MTAPVFLVVLAVATAVFTPVHLVRATWARRQPSWAIWAWQAATLTVTGALLLAAATLAVPVLPFGSHLADVLSSATHLHVAHHYETPAGSTLAWVSFLVGVGLLVRIVVFIALEMRSSAIQRRAHRQVLQLVGERHPDGFTVLDHEVPLAYCLPGRERTVVVTSAALDRLSVAELESVLAHERSHLRARHDLALVLSAALARTFPRVVVFRVAHLQTQTLIEMLADDAAPDGHGRLAMARALLTLSGELQLGGSVTTGDGQAMRVRRLLEPRPAHGLGRQRVLVAAATAVLLSSPLALALVPAVAASSEDCCHVALAHHASQ